MQKGIVTLKKILLCMVIFLSACAAKQAPVMSNSPVADVSDKAQILSVVQAEVKKQHHQNVVLSAQYLKVNQNWAYVETTGGGDPSINAVLKKVKGHWMFAKRSLPCNPICPGGGSDCADGELICKNSLHKQFPLAPVSIFPTPDANRIVFNK